jgi:hypothetical protein
VEMVCTLRKSNDHPQVHMASQDQRGQMCKSSADCRVLSPCVCLLGRSCAAGGDDVLLDCIDKQKERNVSEQGFLSFTHSHRLLSSTPLFGLCQQLIRLKAFCEDSRVTPNIFAYISGVFQTGDVQSGTVLHSDPVCHIVYEWPI